MRLTLSALLMLVSVAVVAVVLLGRSERTPPTQRTTIRTETTTEAAAARRRPTVPPLCRRLQDAVTGRVKDLSLNELSGLVASRTRGGVLYAHEDSGAGPEVLALRTNGTVAGSWTVPGAEAVDWEDIATGPAPSGDGAVLYLGDIGDNRGVRPYVDVYRVPEPEPGASTTAPAQRLRLRYPDGARDAETLLVDPRRGTIVIVSKELDGAHAYWAPSSAFGGEATLTRGPAVDVALATAGDVSADGRYVAVRGYTSMSVWRRRQGDTLTQALRREPCSPPTSLFEGQGEALAINRSGTVARTVNEASPAVLRRYRAAP